MARKKKTNIYKPTGYPYVLYNIGAQFVVAVSEDQAKERVVPKRPINRIKTPVPVHVKKLTDDLGHKKAHDLLSNFGHRWMCKDGYVFFPAD